MTSQNNYDVVIICSKEHLPLLDNNIKYIQKNLAPKQIKIITAVSNVDVTTFADDESVVFLNEDEIYPGMTISKIKNTMIKIAGTEKRAGWYFQQFLKMAYSLICQDEEYLIWDADTIPLKPLLFKDSNQLYFTMEYRYFKDYFNTLYNLLGYFKKENKSFVAEHMIIDVKIMKELISVIESKELLSGERFYEKILGAIDPKKILGTGFSEFETYGTYVQYKYPSRYSLRDLEILRNGRSFLGNNPNTDLMNWLSKYYDTVSLELWDKPLPLIPRLLGNKVLRETFVFEKIFLSISRLPQTLLLCYYLINLPWIKKGIKNQMDR